MLAVAPRVVGYVTTQLLLLSALNSLCLCMVLLLLSPRVHVDCVCVCVYLWPVPVACLYSRRCNCAVISMHVPTSAIKSLKMH